MIKILVVNLFGAPGAGKSTGAAYIFANLKMLGINAELVTEFAKDKVWEENTAALRNQAYIFGEQYFRISCLQDKVDVVVTDSPLLLSSYYKDDRVFGEEFDRLVLKVFNSYRSINAFIDRVKPYTPSGRLQTREESDEVAKELIRFLDDHKVVVKHYQGDIDGYERLIGDIYTNIQK